MDLDIDFVRKQFPAFEQASLEDKAFFENAGGSYTCKQVIKRLTRFYTQRKVQPYGSFEASRLGGDEMDEARDRLAQLMGVSPQEVSFGPSTSQNTYVLAQAFGQLLTPNDAIVVTNQDHEANTGRWRKLSEAGIEVREWKIDPDTGHLDIEDLKNLCDDKVKLVCFPHCSNVVAEINPVAQIVDLAHSAGAYACVDGVSFAPHGIPNVGKLGADIYMFSTYKTYGPHQGVMVVRQGVAEALPNQAHYFNAQVPTAKFTPAGPDHAQIAACAGIVDYYEDLHRHHFSLEKNTTSAGEEVNQLVASYEQKLLQPLLDYVAQKNSVRLLGPCDAAIRAPTVAMELKEPGFEVANKLEKYGIMAGGGDFYGVRCLEGLGVDPGHGALRVSFVHYTSEAEVTKLIEALDQVV